MVEGKIVEKRNVAENTDLWQQRMEQERIERERIEQELQVARRIQQASLPKRCPRLEGWEISPSTDPLGRWEETSTTSTYSPRTTGPRGGRRYRQGRTSGLGHVHHLRHVAVAALALELLPFAWGGTRAGQRGVVSPNPSNMFVTCFYAILDPKSGHLTYANAGHDLPYLHRNGDAEELRARGMPLGLMPAMGYEDKEIELDVGEGVFFYSDGLVEAHDPEGEMFGFPRLRALVAEHAEEEEKPLGDFLMEELYTFVGEGWEQEDDITLLTLERSAT